MHAAVVRAVRRRASLTEDRRNVELADLSRLRHCVADWPWVLPHVDGICRRMALLAARDGIDELLSSSKVETI